MARTKKSMTTAFQPQPQPGVLNNSPIKASRQNPLLVAAFEELTARFLNCPDEALASWERLFFQLEAAHWHYEDFIRVENPQLPSFRLKEFTRQFFHYCPILQPYQSSVDQFVAGFNSYKVGVPVFGAILLNPSMDSCLLVRGMGTKSAWTFPKGKVNRDESEIVCAAREVLEEVGFDSSSMLKEDLYLAISGDHQTRLYLCPNVPDDTVFITQTRQEIGDIAWFRLSDLPTRSTSPNFNQFYLVAPFIKPLRSWIQQQQQQPQPKPRTILKPPHSIASKPQKSEPKSVSSMSESTLNATTFGTGKSGWGVQEMFKTNEKLFGVTSNYSYELYTTKLPTSSDLATPVRSDDAASSTSSGSEGRTAPHSDQSKSGKRRSRRKGQSQAPAATTKETFGVNGRWGVQEMFETNRKLFGVVSDYNFEMYTTKLDKSKSSPPSLPPSSSSTAVDAAISRNVLSAPSLNLENSTQSVSATGGVSVSAGASEVPLRLLTPSLLLHSTIENQYANRAFAPAPVSHGCGSSSAAQVPGWSGFKFNASAIMDGLCS